MAIKGDALAFASLRGPTADLAVCGQSATLFARTDQADAVESLRDCIPCWGDPANLVDRYDARSASSAACPRLFGWEIVSE